MLVIQQFFSQTLRSLVKRNTGYVLDLFLTKEKYLNLFS
jgi:hypothetical protein